MNGRKSMGLRWNKHTQAKASPFSVIMTCTESINRFGCVNYPLYSRRECGALQIRLDLFRRREKRTGGRPTYAPAEHVGRATFGFLSRTHSISFPHSRHQKKLKTQQLDSRRAVRRRQRPIQEEHRRCVYWPLGRWCLCGTCTAHVWRRSLMRRASRAFD